MRHIAAITRLALAGAAFAFTVAVPSDAPAATHASMHHGYCKTHHRMSHHQMMMHHCARRHAMSHH